MAGRAAIIAVEKARLLSLAEEEKQFIPHQSENTAHHSTALADVAEPSINERTPPSAKGAPPKLRKRWFSKGFSFHFKNLLPGGGDLSLRNFSITEAALLLVSAFLVSRGLGVVRQALFNALFGTGPEANAYYAASRFPETIFDLIAGGALTHAFIPVFLSHEKNHGQREAWRLVSLVFNLLLVALTALVLIGEFAAPVFVSRLLVPGYPPAVQALTTSLTRIMLIQPLILGVGTVIAAVLDSKRHFFLPAISLAIYNVGLICGLLFTLANPSIGIYGPTYGVLAAALLQVGVMVPGLVKQDARYSFYWDLKYPALRDVMRLLGPNVLAVAITSTGFIVDTAFISFMPDKASLAASRNAHLLYALPLALIGQTIALAGLPQLSALAAAGRYVRLRVTMAKLLTGAFVLSIIACLGLYLFGKPMIRLLYQHGAFGKHSSSVTGTALLGYAIALPGTSLALVLVIGFYALKDARIPLFASILGLAARWSLIVLLLKSLSGSHVILAIPLAAAGTGVVESLFLSNFLYWRLRSKVKTDKGMLRLERVRNHRRDLAVLEPERVENRVYAPEPTDLRIDQPEETELEILPVDVDRESEKGEHT